MSTELVYVLGFLLGMFVGAVVTLIYGDQRMRKG